MLGTARGSGTDLMIVGPTEFKACKSVLLTGGTPEAKIKNTWLMICFFQFVMCKVYDD